MRRDSQKSNEEKSSPNGGNEGKGSGSDVNHLDVESASVVRVEVSDDDIRAIAEDSIVPTEGQSIEDFKTRERKLKALLKEKGFVKVKSDGDRRYVKKAIDRTSFCSVVKHLFCLEAEEQNQVRDAPNQRLEAQVGREDSTNRNVNKSIGDQNVGRKRKIIPVVSDPQLRDVKSPQSEFNRLKPKKEWTPMKVKQYEALKQSFDRMLIESERIRKPRIDLSVLESESKQKEPIPLEEEGQNSGLGGLDMVLESELAQIRQIDQSVIESITKRSDSTYLSEEWPTLASEILENVSESECSSVRLIDVSALKPESKTKEPEHQKNRESSALETLELISKSELAQIRQIDESVFGSITKKREMNHQVEVSESLAPEALDIVSESDLSSIRHIDVSVLKQESKTKEPAPEECHTLEPETSDTDSESDSSSLRHFDEFKIFIDTLRSRLTDVSVFEPDP